MKKEDLFEALEDLDPRSVQKAREYRGHKRPKWVVWAAAAACAAILIGAIMGFPAIRNGGGTGPIGAYPSGVTAVLAAFPAPIAQSLSAQAFVKSDEGRDWWSAYRKTASETADLQSGMVTYNAALMSRLLVSEEENTICSPLSTYIAFAMLAEVTEGNTRRQILDALGAADLETLRGNVTALWKSNYADTPALKSLLANSIWLNSGVAYNADTLNRLAEAYYASSFSGVPGSREMNKALQTWTDTSTGGFLREYTKEMSLEPGTVLDILSTVYFKAMWLKDFREANTAPGPFHGTAGDTTAEMMHKTDVQEVYRTERFTAVGLSLNYSGSLYFLLPNAGTDVSALAADPDIYRMARSGEADENRSFITVILTVPKFRVLGKTDLLEAVRALGMTDVLNPALADFSPLTTDRTELYLSKAEHAAMLEIDEHGVTGTAYTALAVAEARARSDEELDFAVDRPFMFILTARDGSILFAGIVRNVD